MQKPDPTILADAPATLARLRRRAGADRPTPQIDSFEDCAAVLAAAELVADEARAVRARLAASVTAARSAGEPSPTLEEMGAAFGASKQAAGAWGRSG